MNQPLLSVENLSVSFKTYAGIMQAVRDVSFTVSEGETLAIVGESGCGKTVTSKAIMGLLPPQQAIVDSEKSKIFFMGNDIIKMNEEQQSQIRGKDISMIFQDPMTSLNPTMRIGDQIAESLIIHQNLSHQEALKKAEEMIELVRIPNAKQRIRQYPFEFSGGMRQRAMIAVALVCKPRILIADEPTTALDVTIQAQIMDLIGDLKKELNMGVILVTHDLGVVASVADNIQVMYAGKVVEYGSAREVFYSPKHPYTLALLKSVPRLSTENKDTLYSLKGTPPDLLTPPPGCAFAARCDYGMKVCRRILPEFTKFGSTQRSACWLHNEKADRSGLPEAMFGGVR